MDEEKVYEKNLTLLNGTISSVYLKDKDKIWYNNMKYNVIERKYEEKRYE